MGKVGNCKIPAIRLKLAFLAMAGFLTLYACNNPWMAALFVDEEKPPLTLVYTISFNSNGGNTVPSQIVAEGGTASRPLNPAKSGNGFINWYSDEELTVVYDFATPVFANITLYAKWSSTVFTVIFHNNGGSYVDNQTVGEGGTVNEPVSTREGYEFGGWYRDSELTILYNFTAPVTENIDLYAKWFTIPVTGVTLNKNMLGLAIGHSETLIAILEPDNASNRAVTWSSSDESVATVTGGLVTAVGEGTATITVTTADGGFAATCEVTVSLTFIAVTGVTLENTTASFFVGDTETFVHTIVPSDATNKAVTWESDAPGVATVSSIGFVTAVGVGTADITVTTLDGSYTASCIVTVTSAEGFPPFNHTPLIENIWADGEITAATPDKENWYTISVTTGTTYYIWWNDAYEGGPVTKTLDVKVSARYENGTNIFSDVDNGWTSPRSFNANVTGTVYIRVNPFGSSGTGTYGIVYSTGNTRPNIDWTPPTPIPLYDGVWFDGEITIGTPGREDWYSISVTAGIKYYLWWNDLNHGDGNKTLNVNVSAWYDNGNIIIFSRSSSNNNGWDSPVTFTPSSNAMVYIRAFPNNSSQTGTYGIVYSTNNARPGWTQPSNPTPLIENLWVNGEITTTTPNREDWYSISVIAGKTYYLWWNDGYQNSGDGTKTLDIKVSALYNGISVVSDVDNGWNSPSSFTAISTGTVYIRVYPFSSGTGTYGIVYSTTNTRPDFNTAVIIINISVNQIEDGTPSITIPADQDKISRKYDGTIVLNAPVGYTRYEWTIDGAGVGTIVTYTGNPFTVNANNSNYNSIGRHIIYLVAYRGTVPYSKTIEFWITE